MKREYKGSPNTAVATGRERFIAGEVPSARATQDRIEIPEFEPSLTPKAM
ncbi:hypothetical protein NHF46_18700 [Arthrobacter alpinus]|nr:hypothetical protein [Arthrobacter alpinus]